MKILLIEDDFAECNEFEKSVRDFENITICAMTNNATERKEKRSEIQF